MEKVTLTESGEKSVQIKHYKHICWCILMLEEDTLVTRGSIIIIMYYY